MFLLSPHDFTVKPVLRKGTRYWEPYGSRFTNTFVLQLFQTLTNRPTSKPNANGGEGGEEGRGGGGGGGDVYGGAIKRTYFTKVIKAQVRIASQSSVCLRATVFALDS